MNTAPTVQSNSSNPKQDNTRWWTLSAIWWVVQSRPNRSVASLLFLLAVVFLSPGLLPGRVAAPMNELLPFEPWHSYYPRVNPPFHGGDLLLQQLPWRHWAQQEFGIAAALSGDEAMMAAYQSGDPYLALAIATGAAPADLTRS